MPQSNWWDEKPFYFMSDGWKYTYDIPAILSEHSKRIVKELEGMKVPDCRNCLTGVGECYCTDWNAVLDEAIKKVSEMNQ